MTEPLFTARGNKVKISGNTDEKTRCGDIDIYKNRLEIEQKGTIRQKGWITIMFSKIDSISVSSKLSGSKLHIVTRSNDYKVSMFHATSRNEKPAETVEEIRKLIREVNSSPTDVNITNSNELGGGSVADEIEKLADLKERGVLSEEEFEKKKRDLL